MKRLFRMTLLLVLTFATMLPMTLIASATNGSIAVRGTIGGWSTGGTSTSYKVTYDANGGVGAHAATGISYGGTHKVLTPEAAGIAHPDGHGFIGWDTKPDGSGADYLPGDTITLRGNVTLYAQWKRQDNLSHAAYLYGYPDGSVRPDNAITRAEAAAIFCRLLTGGTGTGGASSFSDVMEGQWYVGAVNYLTDIGAIVGYPDGTFRPNQTITRAEFVTVATRINNLTLSGVDSFPDVNPGHWAYDFVGTAYASGWITGYPDGTFRPQHSITRAEVVTIANAQFGRSINDAALAVAENPYTDIATSHWAYADIIEASVGHGFIRDSEGVEIWR